MTDGPLPADERARYYALLRARARRDARCALLPVDDNESVASLLRQLHLACSRAAQQQQLKGSPSACRDSPARPRQLLSVRRVADDTTERTQSPQRVAAGDRRPMSASVDARWLTSLALFTAASHRTDDDVAATTPTKQELALQLAPVPFPRRVGTMASSTQRAQRYAMHVQRRSHVLQRSAATDSTPQGLARYTTLPSFGTAAPCAALATPPTPQPPQPRASVESVRTGQALHPRGDCGEATRLSETRPASALTHTRASSDDGGADASQQVPDGAAPASHGATSKTNRSEGSPDAGLVSAAARLLENTTTMLFAPAARDVLGRTLRDGSSRFDRENHRDPCGIDFSEQRVREARVRRKRAQWLATWEAAREEKKCRARVRQFLASDDDNSREAQSASHALHWYDYGFNITAQDLHPAAGHGSEKKKKQNEQNDEKSDVDSLRTSDSSDDALTGSVAHVPRRRRRDGDGDGQLSNSRHDHAGPSSLAAQAMWSSAAAYDAEEDLSQSFFDSAGDGGGGDGGFSPAHSRAHMSSSRSLISVDLESAEVMDKDDSNNHKGHAYHSADDASTERGRPEAKDAQQGATPRQPPHESSDGSFSYGGSFAFQGAGWSPRSARLASPSPSRLDVRDAHVPYVFTPVPRTAPLPTSALTAAANRDAASVTKHRSVDAVAATCVRFTPSGEGYLIGTANGVLWYVPSRREIPALQVTALGTVHPPHHHHRTFRRHSDGGSGSPESEPHAHSWRMVPLQGHSDAITSLDFNDDGSLFCSGSLDGSVILWSTARHDKVRRIQVAAVQTTAVAAAGTLASTRSPLAPEDEQAVVDDVMRQATAVATTLARRSEDGENIKVGKTSAGRTLAGAKVSASSVEAVPCQVSFVPLNNNFLLVLSQLPQGTLRLFNCSTGLAVAQVALAPLTRDVPRSSRAQMAESRRAVHHTDSGASGTPDHTGTSASGGGSATSFLSSFFAAGPAAIMGFTGSARPVARNTSHTNVRAGPKSSSSLAAPPKATLDSSSTVTMTAMAVTPRTAPFFFTGDASGHVHMWSFRASALTPLPTLRQERRQQHRWSSAPEQASCAPLLATQPRQLPELHHMGSCMLPGTALTTASEHTRVGAASVGRLEVAAMNAAQASAWLAATVDSDVTRRATHRAGGVQAPSSASPTPHAVASAVEEGKGTVQRLLRQLTASLGPTTAEPDGEEGKAGPSRSALWDHLLPFMLVASQPSDTFHVLTVTQHTRSAVKSREGTHSSSQVPLTEKSRPTKGPLAAPTFTTRAPTSAGEARESAPAVSHALVVLHTVRGVCRLRHVMPWCAPLSARYGRGGGALFCTDNTRRPVVTCACDEGFVHLLSVPMQTRRSGKRFSPPAESKNVYAPAEVGERKQSTVALASLALPCGGVCSDLAWSPDARFLVAVTTDGWVYEWERLYLWGSTHGRGHNTGAGAVASSAVADEAAGTRPSASVSAVSPGEVTAHAATKDGETIVAASAADMSTAGDDHSIAATWEPRAGLEEEEEWHWWHQVCNARQAQRMAWLRTHPEALNSSNSDEEASVCASRLGEGSIGSEVMSW